MNEIIGRLDNQKSKTVERNGEIYVVSNKTNYYIKTKITNYEEIE